MSIKTQKYLVGICGGSYGVLDPAKIAASEAISREFGFKRINLVDVVKEAAKSSGIDDFSSNKAIDYVCRSGRKICEDFWLNLSTKKIGNNDKIVFDDLWFSNEAKFIKDNGGIVIMVSTFGTFDQELDFEPDVTLKHLTLELKDIEDAVINAVSKHFTSLKSEIQTAKYL